MQINAATLENYLILRKLSSHVPSLDTMEQSLRILHGTHLCLFTTAESQTTRMSLSREWATEPWFIHAKE